MEKPEKRRINPIAQVTMLAVMTLLIFEGLVIGGIFELKSQTVAKYAPWAYEPFLRLVGEHPDSSARWVVVEKATEEEAAKPLNELFNASGMEPSAIPVLIATNKTNAVFGGTNAVFEPSMPLKVNHEPIPEEVPTHAPKNSDEETIPVG